MSKIMSNIIDGLHGEVGQYGKLYESVNESDEWITIKGTHVLTDGDGNIKNEKLAKKIENTSKDSKPKKSKKGLGKGLGDLMKDSEKSSSKGLDKVIPDTKKEKKTIDATNKVNHVKYSDADSKENLKHLHDNSEANKKYKFFKSENGDVDKEAVNKFIEDVADKMDERRERPTADEYECLKALNKLGALSKEDSEYVEYNFLRNADAYEN